MAGSDPIQLGVICSGMTTQVVEQRLATAAEAGWRVVQVSLYGDASPDDWSDVIDRAHELGLRVAALGAYPMLVEPHRPRFFDCSMANAYAAIKVLEKLPIESRQVIVWSGTFDHDLLTAHPHNRTISTWDRTVKVAADLVRELAPTHGKVLIEPFYAHVLGQERDFILFFRDVARSLGLKDDWQSLPLKIVLDPPNLVDEAAFVRLGDRIDEVIMALAPITGLIHLKDIDTPQGESPHLRLPEPGGGKIDYERMLQTLRRHIAGPMAAVAEHFDETDLAAHRRVRTFLHRHARIG